MNPVQEYNNLQSILSRATFNNEDDAINHYRNQSLTAGLGPSFLVRESHGYIGLRHVFVHPDGNIVVNGSHAIAPWALSQARQAAIVFLGTQVIGNL